MTTDGDRSGRAKGDVESNSDAKPDGGVEPDGDVEPYADLGATTEAAMDIAETSMERVRGLVRDETLADRVRQKAVHATGDPEFQYLVRFTGDGAESSDRTGDSSAGAPETSATVGTAGAAHERGQDVAGASAVRAGARAVLDERPIVTDITMVEAGITGRGHDCEVRKAIGNGAELAAETGMTRTAASVLELDRDGAYDGAVAVVGNAPTAALALADCIEQGTRPAVVVATPVGFVKAAESRERLRDVAAEHDVPTITTVGRRGGSGLAAGLTNELVHVASDVRDGEIDLDREDSGSTDATERTETDATERTGTDA